MISPASTFSHASRGVFASPSWTAAPQTAVRTGIVMSSTAMGGPATRILFFSIPGITSIAGAIFVQTGRAFIKISVTLWLASSIFALISMFSPFFHFFLPFPSKFFARARIPAGLFSFSLFLS